MAKFIESSESWLTSKLDRKKLKVVLLSQCNVPLHGLSDNIFQILNKWMHEMGSNATIEILKSALGIVGCSKLIGKSLFHFMQSHQYKQFVCYVYKTTRIFLLA